MKKFVVSDLHGCSDIYVSLITYLENVSMVGKEKVHLYINGDLIDRGLDSYKMLLDVIYRCNHSDNLVVHYIGGNHEQLMFESCLDKLKHGHFNIDSWDLNGSFSTKSGISEMEYDEFIDLINFVGNLDIYQKFQEKVGKDNVLVVHAAAPRVVLNRCDLKLSSNSSMVEDALWSRIGRNGCKKLGKNGYFTIVGHTPNCNKHGFTFDSENKVLNIDGGCGKYANGAFEYDKVPVVEICDGYVKVLVFNHDNKIVEGYYIKNNVKLMSDKELERHNIMLEHNLNDCGSRFRARVLNAYKQQNIDVKIYDSSKKSNVFVEDDSDMKIYSK